MVTQLVNFVESRFVNPIGGSHDSPYDRRSFGTTSIHVQHQKMLIKP